MAVEVGNDDVLLPRDSHPLEFGQAVVAGCFVFCDVFGEERDVGEAIEDDLVHVLELAVRLEAEDQPSFEHDHDFLLDEVDLLDEAVGQ